MSRRLALRTVQAKASRKRLAKVQSDRRFIRRLGEIQDKYWHDQARMLAAMRRAADNPAVVFTFDEDPPRRGFWRRLWDVMMMAGSDPAVRS